MIPLTPLSHVDSAQHPGLLNAPPVPHFSPSLEHAQYCSLPLNKAHIFFFGKVTYALSVLLIIGASPWVATISTTTDRANVDASGR